jgi:hypothetical protein
VPGSAGQHMEAWVVLTERPVRPENPARQHRLRGQLGSRQIGGQVLEQWQYEVTSAGRIWYCPEPQRGIVWWWPHLRLIPKRPSEPLEAKGPPCSGR